MELFLLLRVVIMSSIHSWTLIHAPLSPYLSIFLVCLISTSQHLSKLYYCLCALDLKKERTKRVIYFIYLIEFEMLVNSLWWYLIKEHEQSFTLYFYYTKIYFNKIEVSRQQIHLGILYLLI